MNGRTKIWIVTVALCAMVALLIFGVTAGHRGATVLAPVVGGFGLAIGFTMRAMSKKPEEPPQVIHPSVGAVGAIPKDNEILHVG